jgi:glutamate N-acetyltransferase/amino-acid N-acetyltransferase
VTSTVNLPQGFRAAGVTAGLKASGRSDLALVVNDGPDHHAAAVFTSNRVEAAPVTWSRQVVSDGRVDAVILNSGGANACTGSPGFLDTHRTAEKVGEVLGVSAGDVVVCSTGLIGERLPMDLLLPGVDAVATALSVDGHDAAATAIMTTDTVSKQATFVGDGWSVSGMAKGAGMLAPALATMLVVITTDAVTHPKEMDLALRGATAVSFDRIDSDGCMSTNDTVLLMASGASGVKPGWKALLEGVTRVCLDLAVQLIADAEGAHHDIEIEVRSAASEADALEVARASPATTSSSVRSSATTPTGVGCSPRSEPRGPPSTRLCLSVTMNGIQVCRDGGRGGGPLAGRPDATAYLRDRRPARREAMATVWTNDLTHDYVHENSAYST